MSYCRRCGSDIVLILETTGVMYIEVSLFDYCTQSPRKLEVKSLLSILASTAAGNLVRPGSMSRIGRRLVVTTKELLKALLRELLLP